MPNFFNISYRLGFQRAQTFYNKYISSLADAGVGYIMLGRSTSWGANDAPIAIYDTENTSFDTYSQFLGGKKITGNDVYLVVPRVNWSSNVVWTQYDDASNTQFTGNSMYIYASGGNVYKCLNNANGAPSTIEPANNYTTDNGFTNPGDGYLWKYMYKVPTSSKFLTAAWMPVPTLQTAAYFGYDTNLLPGAISRLILSSGGFGYSNTNTTILITGSGASANATANVNANGNVISVTLNNRGSGYTRENTRAIVVGSGTGANLRFILSPYRSHAFNPARELGANSVMIAVKIGDVDATEGDTITSNNDFRQVGLLLHPHKYGEVVPVPAANANSAVRMTTRLLLTAGPSYFKDEIVYQGVAIANAKFLAYTSDIFTNAIDCTGRIGTPIPGELLVGANSGVSRTTVAYSNPELDPGSGDLVFIENRTAVIRTNGQSEWIKIVLSF